MALDLTTAYPQWKDLEPYPRKPCILPVAAARTDRWVLLSGEVRPGVRSTAVWTLR